MKRLGTLPLIFFSTLPPMMHVPENLVPGLPSMFSVTSSEGALASTPSPFAVLNPPTRTTASPARATTAEFPSRTTTPAFACRTWSSDSSGTFGAISAVVGSFTLFIGCRSFAASWAQPQRAAKTSMMTTNNRRRRAAMLPSLLVCFILSYPILQVPIHRSVRKDHSAPFALKSRYSIPTRCSRVRRYGASSSLIHPSAWKVISANLALRGYSEVRLFRTRLRQEGAHPPLNCASHPPALGPSDYPMVPPHVHNTSSHKSQAAAASTPWSAVRDRTNRRAP